MAREPVEGVEGGAEVEFKALEGLGLRAGRLLGVRSEGAEGSAGVMQDLGDEGVFGALAGEGRVLATEPGLEGGFVQSEDLVFHGRVRPGRACEE
jgi:hypothetical protein